MNVFDEHIECLDIPDGFKRVQQSIDSFVRINYDTAQTMAINMKIAPADTIHLKGKILDIIRNNPPLTTVPKYLCDGREDYLWYSDFYDDIAKDVYFKYHAFVEPRNEITVANYAEELAKVDLPYFKEPVDLISLERLCLDYERKELPNKQSITALPKPKSTAKQLSEKRSYEPKLNNKQYALLAKCMERIKLFRRPASVTDLKRLLKGKLPEPLQVTNQKSLVYLMKQLKEYKYIKKTWISVADGNKDFTSFRTEGNKQRYGDKEHDITAQQFQNNLAKCRKEYVHGLVDIEETIELMEEYRDK